MAALATVLLYQASTPDTQERMRGAANSMVESAKSAGGTAKGEIERQLKISIFGTKPNQADIGKIMFRKLLKDLRNLSLILVHMLE